MYIDTKSKIKAEFSRLKVVVVKNKGTESPVVASVGKVNYQKLKTPKPKNLENGEVEENKRRNDSLFPLQKFFICGTTLIWLTICVQLAGIPIGMKNSHEIEVKD